jgi:hypothetical protein
VLAALMLATSVLVAGVDVLKPFFYLVPKLFLEQFFVWQPISYSLVETSPSGVIFGAIILWSIGGALDRLWGRRKLLLMAIGMPALGALGTILISLVVPSFAATAYGGATVMTSVLWVGYGLTIGRNATNFWGMPVTGNILAAFGAGFVALNAAFNGLATVLPAVFALLFTFIENRSPVAHFKSFVAQRKMKKRSAHLSALDGGKQSGSRGSDNYLN